MRDTAVEELRLEPHCGSTQPMCTPAHVHVHVGLVSCAHMHTHVSVGGERKAKNPLRNVVLLTRETTAPAEPGPAGSLSAPLGQPLHAAAQ